MKHYSIFYGGKNIEPEGKMTTLVQTQKSIVVHCPNCGHYKSRHVKSFGCLICFYMLQQGWAVGKQCTEFFKSRLSQHEMDQARQAPKDSYGAKTLCATCMEIWWAHDGLLCPNGETTFVQLIGGAEA